MVRQFVPDRGTGTDKDGETFRYAEKKAELIDKVRQG